MDIFNRKLSVKTTIDNYYCWIRRVDYHVIYIIEVSNEMKKKEDISIISTSLHVQYGLSAHRTGDTSWWYSDICRFYFPNSKWNYLSFNICKMGSNIFSFPLLISLPDLRFLWSSRFRYDRLSFYSYAEHTYIAVSFL